VLDALRRTSPGSVLVQNLTAAPDLDAWAIVERLLKDLAPLREPLWLVVDDLHELAEDQVLRQLELLVLRAPPELRFVLAARHDVRLGLHRLRLEGQLVELRAADLRFSVAEAAELFAAAGVTLSEAAVALLHERTEGWAAGLRLAALSLATHPDPERFAELAGPFAVGSTFEWARARGCSVPRGLAVPIFRISRPISGGTARTAYRRRRRDHPHGVTDSSPSPA